MKKALIAGIGVGLILATTLALLQGRKPFAWHIENTSEKGCAR